MTPTETYMIAYLVNKGIKPPMIDKLMEDEFLEHCDDVLQEFSNKLSKAYNDAQEQCRMERSCG